MNIQYRFKVGQSEFTLTLDVENEKDFFKQVSFYSSLPSVGPNGEDDLQITFRTAGKFSYYSLVSQKAQQEFTFGQHLEGDSLFPKGWRTLYESRQEEGSDPAPQKPRPAPTVAAKVSLPQVKAAAPTVNTDVSYAPTPAPTAPVPTAPAPSAKVVASTNAALARFGLKQKQ